MRAVYIAKRGAASIPVAVAASGKSIRSGPLTSESRPWSVCVAIWPSSG